ncbi:MAG: cytochrome c biogenesis protein ResB [Pseudomonadota bacterium]|nr:cytochrome c biogenesis protein ResB [Pseudomonadota bacterium]
MTSTAGLQLKTRRHWLASLVELVSSMRFAISLLALLAVASVIGTIMKQNEPLPNYVNQFGPFWVEVFDKIGLYAVYSSWWFLLITAFLALSTALCISRNAPKMWKDMRSWRDSLREQSLRNFHHKCEWESPLPRTALAQQLASRIGARGYQVKLVDKDNAILIAAKRGAANKWGYIFAHSAILVICIGAVVDSDLPLRLQAWAQNKTPFSGNGVIAQIGAQHRLGLDTVTFRGNTLIPEGGDSNTAIISEQSGSFIQELPVTIHLKRFVIDFYSTGMPKLFASEVEVTDHATGARFPARIEVNHPLIYKGLALYQSSFEDGGSRLQLTGYPLTGAAGSAFALNGEVGNATSLQTSSGDNYSVEWSGFRPFNVENMAQSGQDLRAVSVNQGFSAALGNHLGSAAKSSLGKDLKNVGPSVQYKLRDKTGQAREYMNYMQPVRVDGADVFFAGMRESPSDAFRYLRIPADDNDSVDEWMRLRAALADPALRQRAAQRYAERALTPSKSGAPNLRDQLAQSAARGLEIFAGDTHQSGYIAVTKFLERVPAADQEKAADVFMKILNGSMWELWQLARADAQLAPVPADEKHARFLQLATNAYADMFFYGAPVFLQLKSFEEVKASVLQVSRAPGKKVVYLGCLMLVMGIFSMLYIRERRLWIWISTTAELHSRALMAMSAQRITLDVEKEFALLLSELPQR